MSSLGDDFRKRSDEQHAAAMKLLESPSFGVDAKEQAVFVVGKVTANVFEALGEVVDYLRGTASLDAAAKKRAEIMERNDAIRNAAVAREWTEFDRLVAEFGTGGGSGSDCTE